MRAARAARKDRASGSPFRQQSLLGLAAAGTREDQTHAEYHQDRRRDGMRRDGLAGKCRRQREGDKGLQQLHLRHPRNAAHRHAGIPGEEADPLRELSDPDT